MENIAESLYYLPDATGYVRQGVNADGAVVNAWLFDPDGGQCWKGLTV